MNRIDRLTAILVKLQSKSATSSQELADHFDISLRTVYRDIRALGEAGVPIGLDQGRGYFIVDGYHLPPVMLTKEEAGAILLAGKLIEKMGDKSVTTGFNSALMKINSVLKGEQRDYVENLDKYISVVKPHIPQDENFPDHFLADLKTALVHHNLVEFEYYSKYVDASNLRQVEPLGLVFYTGHWHLIAYCRLREAVRDFRTDRIMKLRLLDDHFEPRFNGEYKHLIRTLMQESEVQEVKIKVSFEIARYISDQKYYYGFVNEQKQDDGVVMTYMVGNLNYFARWLIMYGDGADVVEPTQLREEVMKVVNELSAHYYTADIGLSP